MIKSIIKLGLLLVVGIIVYNLYWGTTEEKASSKKFISEVGELLKSGVDLVKNEKEKFDQGKYDNALDKIGDAFQTIREKAKSATEGGAEWLQKINELERKKNEIKEKLHDNSPETDENDTLTEKGKEQKKNLDEELQKLVKETEELVEGMKKKQ